MPFPPLRLREALSLGGLSPAEAASRTLKKLQEHELLTRAAAVSFYAMLALVPFLAVVLTIVVQLLPNPQTGEPGAGNVTTHQLEATVKSIFPEEAAGLAVKSINEQIVRIQNGNFWSIVTFGLAVSLWTASSLFLSIIDAMNVIYGVDETRPFWKLRLTAIVMTLIQAVILIGALIAIVIWPYIPRWLGLDVGTAVLAAIVHWTVVLLMVLLSFALTFYVGPDAEQRWEWITPGSLIGTIVFLLGSFLFGLYVQNFGNYNKTYGSLGGVMVLLFWFWVSSVVLLAAGQLNKVIEDAAPTGRNFGQKIDTTEPPDLRTLRPEPLASE